MNHAESSLCIEIAGRGDALLDDLIWHVACPTGGNNTEALTSTRDLLCGRAAALGATLELVPGEARPGWLYGERGGSSAPLPPTAICRRESAGTGERAGGHPILIAGHLDTVHDPNGVFQGLTLSADGRTGVGPGCVDMKGGLVIALHALEALETCGHRIPWTLLLNSDEETGSYHSRAAIQREAARVAGLGGVGFALEPATPDGGLVTERAGSGQFMIEVKGTSAHVGRDFASGVSAVTALAEILVRVATLSDGARGVIVNVGPIEGGTATNVVPDRARAWGNVRFPTPEAAADLEAQLRAASITGTRAQSTLTTSFARPAKPLTPGTLRLAELCRAVATDLGQSLPFSKTSGVCDGNLMQEAGLPTLDTLGVRGGGLHTPQEWIEVPSLVERCQLLAIFMLRANAG